MTIGILEDNAALCRVMETTLTLAGYEVVTHSDPLEFSSFIQQCNIDELVCIIVDVHLVGERTGIDVLRQVRKEYPYLPAIVISGEQLPQAALQDLSHVAFCQKPFHFSTLLATIEFLRDASEKERYTGNCCHIDGPARL